MWSNTLIQIIERDVSVNLRNICAVIRCFNMLDIFESKKKYVQNSYFSRRTEAGAEARGPGDVPEGIFKSPMGEGIWAKITAKKYEFCTYFFLL